MDEFINDNPILIEKNYKEIYNNNCIADKNNTGLKKIYCGLGIKVENHPLKDYINFNNMCANCASFNTKVIYAKWNIHIMSGDKYWDYELVCEDCGKFTTRSYAEND